MSWAVALPRPRLASPRAHVAEPVATPSDHARVENRPDPVGAIAARGTEPFRVLVFGGGALVGWGLREHRLGLPGYLAEELARLTGHGIDLDVVVEPDPTRLPALAALRGLRLKRFDAVVVVLGERAALDRSRQGGWGAEVATALRLLQSECAPTAALAVLTSASAMLALEERGWGGRAARTVAEQQAAVVEQLCATSRRVLFTDLTAPVGETGRQLPAHAYRDWGGVVADRLAPRLAASAAAVSAESPSVFRARNDEWSRQKALTAMRLSADQPNPLLEELVREARRYHRVAGAALTLLDGDLQWALAAEPALAPRPRAEGYCQVTVRHDGITLINDAQKDPRVAGMPVAQRLRFYAGYPLHSWDGHRIGSLCIFDPKPRALLERDFGVLHDLARRAEQELWARALRSR
jgi:hypothetical protein